MGNLSFIVPTKNETKLNVDDVHDILIKEFSQYTYEKGDL